MVSIPISPGFAHEADMNRPYKHRAKRLILYFKG